MSLKIRDIFRDYVPPIAHRIADILIVIDENLKRYEIVYAAGGASNALFGIKLARLQAISGGEFLDLARS